MTAADCPVTEMGCGAAETGYEVAEPNHAAAVKEAPLCAEPGVPQGWRAEPPGWQVARGVRDWG
ncbi:hypothetical protein Msi02_34310 [Microbispora siamensis]|uniref:Uncharacterized protein n=1 Tax=Microbispora siamensis TaxID=564413 RepID=A0ABQ4GMH9_9ACTN|nr:hypothetical protein Msi02_34310 [Microbispora siamensis]